MSEIVSINIPKHPKIAQNIVYFARALRRAGLPIGTGHVIVAVEAVRATGFSEKRLLLGASCLLCEPSGTS